MPLLAKESVQLPPLIVNDKPKILSEMSMKEMHSSLMNAMRQCYKVRPMNVFAQKNEILPWWPTGRISWSVDFKNAFPEDQRQTMYRYLLTTCYMFYGQLHLLHMFDCKPGETVKWTLTKENEMYNLIFLYSGRTVATIPSKKIFPLIAFESKLSELSRLAKSKSNAKDTSKSKLNCSLSSNSSLDSVDDKRLECTLSDVSIRLTPLEISTDEEIAFHCRRNSVSIMGVFSPRRSESETESLPDIETSPGGSLTCSYCQAERFFTKKNLLNHMVKCQPKSRAQIQKSDYLYQLGLVAVETKRAYEKVVETQTPDERNFCFKISNRDQKYLASKLPLSCLLSRKLLSQHKSCTVDSLSGKFFDPQTYKVEKSLHFDDGRQFFPIVYKPPSTQIHYHSYSYTKAERRNRAKYLETGGLNKRSRQLLKLCKKCTVDIERLPDSLLVKHYINYESALTRSKSRGVIQIPKIFDNSNFAKERIKFYVSSSVRRHKIKARTKRNGLPLSKNIIKRKEIFSSILNEKNLHNSGNLVKTRSNVDSLLKFKRQIFNSGLEIRLNRTYFKTNRSATMSTRIMTPCCSKSSKNSKSSATVDASRVSSGDDDAKIKRSMNAIKIMQNTLDSTLKPRRQPAILRRRYSQINDVVREETVTATSFSSENCLQSATAITETDKNKITLYNRGDDGNVRPVCVRLDKTITVPPGIRINGNSSSTLNGSISNRDWNNIARDSCFVDASHNSKRTRNDTTTAKRTGEDFESSILFKCHICGEEKLFSKGTWRNVESHMNSMHDGIACVYTQSEHGPSTSDKRIVLMVEAFNIKR